MCQCRPENELLARVQSYIDLFFFVCYLLMLLGAILTVLELSWVPDEEEEKEATSEYKLINDDDDGASNDGDEQKCADII